MTPTTPTAHQATPTEAITVSRQDLGPAEMARRLLPLALLLVAVLVLASPMLAFIIFGLDPLWGLAAAVADVVLVAVYVAVLTVWSTHR